MSSVFTDDSAERKKYPMYRGLFKYFPDALAAVSRLSFEGNEKHNPGEDIHWSRDKSSDHPDCILRHVMDEDWVNAAWRALAQLQIRIENDKKVDEIINEDMEKILCTTCGKKNCTLYNNTTIPVPSCTSYEEETTNEC